MRQWIRYGLFVLGLCGVAWSATPVQIDFFYEPGCRACEQIEQEFLPEVERRFLGNCEIRALDLGVETNFLYLLQLEDALGYTEPERAYLVVNQQYPFGATPSPEEFFRLISMLLGQEVPEGAVLDAEAASSVLVTNRFSQFTLPAVLLAGLLDGINPCAISTLVFTMSLLAVSKVRKRQFVQLGISFCLASFLTYLGLGFGLFRMLHLFSGFILLRSVVEWGLAVVLLILAMLSLRDAYRFWKTGRVADVTLQLSTRMKKRIHGLLRHGVRSTHLVVGGLLAGVGVTVLESVCTGQVYVPTLVFILKDSSLSESRAWLFLLLYNLLFITPLVIVFIAVYVGLKTETLLRWSKQNVVRSKLLLSLFFVWMAVIMVLL